MASNTLQEVFSVAEALRHRGIFGEASKRLRSLAMAGVDQADRVHAFTDLSLTLTDSGDHAGAKAAIADARKVSVAIPAHEIGHFEADARIDYAAAYGRRESGSAESILGAIKAARSRLRSRKKDSAWLSLFDARFAVLEGTEHIRRFRANQAIACFAEAEVRALTPVFHLSTSI